MLFSVGRWKASPRKQETLFYLLRMTWWVVGDNALRHHLIFMTKHIALWERLPAAMRAAQSRQDAAPTGLERENKSNYSGGYDGRGRGNCEIREKKRQATV
jgi:hypothetical protein